MTTTHASHLRAVPPLGAEHRNGCSLMCRAALRGPQMIRVRALTPVSGSTETLIAVRVGAILLLVADGQLWNHCGRR
jgi:hypothetical protein